MSRARPTDLTCKELVELVTQFLESSLSFEERTRFEHHLVTCPACMTYVRQMQQTVSLARTTQPLVTEASIPEPTKAALLMAFRKWRAS
jgi:anti-sigma factor RsiW